VRYERMRVPCGRRRCEVCGRVWLGDARQVIGGAMAEQGRAVAVLAITAPGADVLPWDDTGRRCREPELSAWNEQAPAAWSWWWRWCSAAPRAYAKRHGETWGLLAKVWEAQSRGALHLHVVLPYGTPVERAATDALVRNLDGSREAAGFGFIDRGALQREESGQRVRKLVPIAPERAAGYVAKYLTDDGKGSRGIGALARTTTVRGPLLFTARRLTEASGKTMRSLRQRRSVYSWFRTTGSGAGSWHAAALVHAVCRERPPLDLASTVRLVEAARAQRWGSVLDVSTGELITPTDCPPPWELRDHEAVTTRPARVGLVRLDYVWHGVWASTRSGPVRTHVTIVDLPRGDDVPPRPSG
jgi:hypothetical protein